MVTLNLLLNALSPASREALLASTHQVDLPLRTVLYEAERAPRYAYFLTSGIASVVASGAEAEMVEVEVVGCEGVVGALHLLGPALAPTQCFMQLHGSALRIRSADLQHLFLESPEVRAKLLEFVQVSALTISQTVACHRLHSAEQRLARWLLMVRDRVHTETLALTQEFLAEMLGSRRTTVSAVASALQNDGIIEYTRGHIRILDRTRLEAVACGCYPIARNLMLGLYRQPPSSNGLYSSSSIVSR